jgi:hypothetical protein
MSPFWGTTIPDAPNAMKGMALVRFVADFVQGLQEPYARLTHLIADKRAQRTGDQQATKPSS